MGGGVPVPLRGAGLRGTHHSVPTAVPAGRPPCSADPGGIPARVAPEPGAGRAGVLIAGGAPAYGGGGGARPGSPGRPRPGAADPAAIADCFRLRIRQVRPALADLVAAGELQEVEVDHPGGLLPMLLHHEAPAATPLRATALVSPFDPIVFFRPRLQAPFDVDYRIENYTRAAPCTKGSYSRLYLHGDRLPARVDLKADREAGVLRVRGTYREELPSMPGRRGLEDDTVAPPCWGVAAARGPLPGTGGDRGGHRTRDGRDLGAADGRWGRRGPRRTVMMGAAPQHGLRGRIRWAGTNRPHGRFRTSIGSTSGQPLRQDPARRRRS